MKRRPLLVATLAAFTGAACVGDIANEEPPASGGKAPGVAGKAPGLGGTKGGGADEGSSPAATRAPFEPLPPRVYAAKVKDVLTGLPLTDDELAAVTADPKVLRTLIDGWMTTPQWKEKAFEFLKSAFQQTQLTTADLEEQIQLTSLGAPNSEQRKMLRSVEEMFARTAMDIIEEGRPFTETVTTTRFRMNLPLMVALSYMDAAPRDDLDRPLAAGHWHLQKFGEKNFKVTLTTNTDPLTGTITPIPFEESIDPTSPNFLKFLFRQPDPLKYKPCRDPILVPGASGIRQMFMSLFGGRPNCQGAPAETSVFTEADWNDWRVVAVRPPKAGEERTTFWEVPKLRDPKTTELVLATPRVGFFTTPAFFANWPTNASNQYRVTTNQALIVALGKSFDDRATTVQVMETGAEDQHVQPGTVCFACHLTLDPMRDFFKQSYSLTYFQQLSPLNPKSLPLPAEGRFTVDGSAPVSGVGVGVFARAMAEHPLFATAWAQKLCQLANADTCNEEDPEFKRVANAWRQSKFDFRTLVRELMSSPLVTFAEKTKTAEEQGVVMSIARRETLCARLGNRLGVKDICNRTGDSGLPRIAGQVKNLSLGVPGSAYARADELPVTPHDPNLFFVSGTEKICMAVAGQVVEVNAMSPFRVAEKEKAVGEFVSVLMGVPPSDPRAPALRQVLDRHYAAAIAAKEKPADALRSAFTLACSSPLGISQGL